MGNLAGSSGYPFGWISANLTAQSQLFGRTFGYSFNQNASLYNRSNLLGVIQPMLDDYVLALPNSYGSINPGSYYCETTILITQKITSLRFDFYNILAEYPPRQTGHIRAYIYSLDAQGKPSSLLYTSTNNWDVTDWITSGYQMNRKTIDFLFSDCTPNQRIAVGYAFEDYAGTNGYIGWLAQYQSPFGPYRYGSYYIRNQSTGISNESYGQMYDFGSVITFEKKSATGTMLDRAAFTPQINFI